MSSICKHGVDCFERSCEECEDLLRQRLQLPHVENMRGTRQTKPNPGLDDYDEMDKEVNE